MSAPAATSMRYRAGRCSRCDELRIEASALRTRLYERECRLLEVIGAMRRAAAAAGEMLKALGAETR